MKNCIQHFLRLRVHGKFLDTPKTTKSFLAGGMCNICIVWGGAGLAQDVFFLHPLTVAVAAATAATAATAAVIASAANHVAILPRNAPFAERLTNTQVGYLASSFRNRSSWSAVSPLVGPHLASHPPLANHTNTHSSADVRQRSQIQHPDNNHGAFPARTIGRIKRHVNFAVHVGPRYGTSNQPNRKITTLV